MKQADVTLTHEPVTLTAWTAAKMDKYQIREIVHSTSTKRCASWSTSEVPNQGGNFS